MNYHLLTSKSLIITDQIIVLHSSYFIIIISSLDLRPPLITQFVNVCHSRIPYMIYMALASPDASSSSPAPPILSLPPQSRHIVEASEASLGRLESQGHGLIRGLPVQPVGLEWAGISSTWDENQEYHSDILWHYIFIHIYIYIYVSIMLKSREGQGFTVLG